MCVVVKSVHFHFADLQPTQRFDLGDLITQINNALTQGTIRHITSKFIRIIVDLLSTATYNRIKCNTIKKIQQDNSRGRDLMWIA